MAAPSFVQAGTGVVVTTGTGSCSLAGTTAGNLIVLHYIEDGSPALLIGTVSGIEDVDGTDSAITLLLGDNIGSPTAAVQAVHFGRSISGGTVSVEVTSVVADVYMRLYEFTGVSTGTTTATVWENGGGTATNGAGTAAQIDDTSVTTNASDRLALQFVGVNDDNAVGSFTGETGGDWAELTPEFASATGTDGCIQIQGATLASAGTINGGSFTMAASDSWGVIGTALIPAAVAAPVDAVMEPILQAVNRAAVY